MPFTSPFSVFLQTFGAEITQPTSKFFLCMLPNDVEWLCVVMSINQVRRTLVPTVDRLSIMKTDI